MVERNTGLRNFVETGTRIDAKVSAELIVTLFSPGSPLHDGAVILREDAPAAPCAMLRTSEPYLAFARAVGILHQQPRVLPGVHPTAVIAADALARAKDLLASHLGPDAPPPKTGAPHE